MEQSILNRARSDKFVFVLDLPKALKLQTDIVLNTSYNPDSIQFTTMGSPVPEISVPEIKVPFGGQVYHASSLSRPAYPPLKLKFLIDSGYKNYWIMWKWLNMLNDVDNSTTELTKPTNYYTDIKLENPMSDFTAKFSLFSLDEFNNKLVEFKYEQAFITNISSIEYSYQDPNEITCIATFVYNRLNVNLINNIDNSNC